MAPKRDITPHGSKRVAAGSSFKDQLPAVSRVYIWVHYWFIVHPKGEKRLKESHSDIHVLSHQHTQKKCHELNMIGKTESSCYPFACTSILTAQAQGEAYVFSSHAKLSPSIHYHRPLLYHSCKKLLPETFIRSNSSKLSNRNATSTSYNL